MLEKPVGSYNLMSLKLHMSTNRPLRPLYLDYVGGEGNRIIGVATAQNFQFPTQDQKQAAARHYCSERKCRDILLLGVSMTAEALDL